MGERAWLFASVVALGIAIVGCAENNPTRDGGRMDGTTTRPDGSVIPTGPCGSTGGACCTGRICELGLRCGRGDVCCIQPGSSSVCSAASDCCSGLACEGTRCCAPRTTACTASSDCCLGLVCGASGVCQLPEEVDPTTPDCGAPGGVCCAGFTCRDEGVCNPADGRCQACGSAGEACCDGTSACDAPTLGCEITRDATGTVTGTECVDVTDPAHACGGVDQTCCPGTPGGTPSECSGDLRCIESAGSTFRCLEPDDTGFEGAPCGPRGGCEPGLVCDRRTNPDGVCETAPDDCGRDGQMCCDLGGSESSCSGSLHCQFGDCSTCRGPSLTCLLGGLLPGQECCAGSVCRPAPLVPRCCMGEGGQCENGLDCCGLMGCNDGTCACSNENSFCLDSSECCDGLTCQTFLCRPAEGETMCKEVGTGCEGASECCAGLTCSETRTEPTAPAPRQCCGAADTSCDSHSDCCGQMLCDPESGECECVMRAGLCDRDVECCDGDICLVGSCQAGGDCVRERQVCDPLEDTCCGMLRCLRHNRDAANYCCVDAGFRCREDADCCGEMTCNTDSERCEPVAEGGQCDTQFDCAVGFSCAESSSGAGDWSCRRPPA